jgi:DNA repair exonuclease SbcCD ATPase subunit
MKLAEALQERADLCKKIDQLRYRLESNATVQEGEQTAENPAELLEELNTAIDRLDYLVARINLTNCTVKADGKTLTEIISEKDSLAKKHSILKDVVERASNITNRATRSEIKIKRTVDVKEIQASADEVAKRIRILDNILQQTNWTADLAE